MILRPLLSAICVLTCIPLPQRQAPEPQQLGRSTAYFPLVGLLFGGVAWLAVAVADAIALPEASMRVVALAVLVVWSVLSGCLHWDGFADVVDALGVRRQGRARMLEVMKDPNIGAFGVVALVIALLLQWESLAILLHQGSWREITLATVTARWAMTILCAFGRPARVGGTGAPFLTHAGTPQFVLSSVLAVALCLWLGPDGRLAVAVVIVALVSGAVFVWSNKVLGGQTGDVLGFAGIIVETILLATFACALRTLSLAG